MKQKKKSYCNLKKQVEYLLSDMDILRKEKEILQAELNGIKKYNLNPMISLQIALEKTTECVAHVLGDLIRYQPKK